MKFPRKDKTLTFYSSPTLEVNRLLALENEMRSTLKLGAVDPATLYHQ